MITKERMQLIRETSAEAKKDFRNRALMVIETLVGDDLVYNDIEKLKSDIYRVAHCAITPKICEHPDWVKETEELFTTFEKEGLI